MTVARLSAAVFAFAAFAGLHNAPLHALPPGSSGLTLAEFEKLHKELTGVKEPWQTLPWQRSLVEACKQAARENKPVYMLCRSGHPLGCV